MIRVATIGSGFIVDWFLNTVSQNEGIECVAMYTRNRQNAEGLANQYHIDTIYTDLDEMLAQPNIDFVYIASPNSLHAPQALKCLKANKHVIVEKPFASNMREFEEVVEYATTHHLYLFEAIVTLHMPNYLTLKNRLSELGPIRMVQCNFSQYSSKYDKFKAGELPNVFNPAFSGGAMADISIYNLHFTIGLFGTPKSVHYFANKHANGIDTSGVCILEYDGFHAVCVGAKDTRSKCIAQVQGENGYALVESETSRVAHLDFVINQQVEHLTIEQNDIALYYEVKEFVEIFEKDDYDACLAKLAHSREVMKVFEAVRKSANIVYDAD